MNIDADKLNRLKELPDKDLWIEVRKMAGAHGLSLPEGLPSHEELEKLRAMCDGVGKISLFQALKIVNDVKRRGKL